jgi:competence protein ComEA
MPATSDRTLLFTIGAAMLAALVAISAVFVASAQPPEPLPELTTPSVAPIVGALPTAGAPSELVVDVEGAVAAPGLHRLPPGSRVANAIDAAGGYAPEADLDAAARQLNLAAALTDGQQLRVPRIGEADGEGAAPGESEGGGLVNLNTASADELDALPGIGPVTVDKIIAARQQAPFSSLDDAVARDVMNAGQLDKIRDLATV